jgi:4-hydroxy-2-oxoheptanedioate aldolase
MFAEKLMEKMRRTAVLGTFITCEAPDLVEVAALSGMDFCVCDCEHGPLTHATSQNLIRAAQLRGMAPILRIPDFSATAALHALDVGAAGVQAPNVNTPQDAQALVRAAKYPPEGARGVAFPRASDYGHAGPDYFARANRDTLVVAHCENLTGLANVEAIARTPGLSVIFFGPYDMSASMGITGQVEHPDVEAAARRVLAAAEAAGIAAGTFVSNGAQARARAEQGFRYIAVGMDTLLYGQALARVVADYNTEHR